MDTDPNHVRAHLTVRGRVQGVYFRASTVQEAQNLRLTGWVRNCLDGSVEAVAEGDRSKVEDLIAWCRRGPRGARVHSVDVNWLVFSGEFQDFRIKR
jgi:acylphosphatase